MKQGQELIDGCLIVLLIQYPVRTAHDVLGEETGPQGDQSRRIRTVFNSIHLAAIVVVSSPVAHS
jgi:hypothetical protein